MGAFTSVSTATESWCILHTHFLCCDADMSERISSDSTVVDLPLTAERALRNSFASEPILNQWDHEELRQLERRSEHSYAGMLHALLDWHSDLDLTGKVHGIDSCHPIPGGYSDIMLGYCTRSDGTEYKVAVKRLRLHIVQDSEFQKKLAKELYIWSKLKNSRILPLEGFYLEDNNYPSLVSRWMENGTVLKYLESNSDTDLLKLITGIAEGITYLHLNDIVHSDIKPDNVVISDAGEPLLCDFGVSRMLEASRSYNFSSSLTGGLRGTIRFMSKELLQATESAPARYSKASDVWAFGMTVLSILTKKPPYHDIGNDVQVITAISNGVLPSSPVDKRLSESTIDLPVFGKRELATSFTAEQILNQQDRDELRRLEQQSYTRTLQTLLDRHSNLDLTGRSSYCAHEDGTRYRVAVKRLRFHIMQGTGFQKKLAKEFYIWSKFNNRILPLEGFYLEDNDYPSLVSRWMENGTVLKYLDSNPGHDLLKLISGIAEGTMYHHLNDIVHSDIKPDNVMISDSGEPLWDLSHAGGIKAIQF
ncbi:kinase-like protein [Sanghuangporus baumii]|uniref:Kinase-like protein n=1 Tax=Sanghuangporus baumii TaxID=108892 RepID=A0A9Q5I5E1_SANBA|nr:kinase-like protein [Sanghuangporus baumii]